jgi:uncharacterized lipoprotein
VGLALAATLPGFAGCGGKNGEGKATPTATATARATATATGTAGLELPEDLTDEQKDAVLQIPNQAIRD